MQKKWLKLPFDQFSRQGQVLSIINALRHDQTSFKIIDIGGHKGVTRSFHVKDEVVVLDVFDVKEKGYVKGDGTRTTFKDDEFDFAVSFDVLEHIKKEHREKFLRESMRIARRGVIAAFPESTEENGAAETMLNNFHKKLYGRSHRWLEEHIAYVIPSSKDVEKIFQKEGLHTVTFSSNDTDLWLLMQRCMFLTSKHIDLAGSDMQKLNIYYNKHLGVFDTVQNFNSYRKVVVALKDEQDYERLLQWMKASVTSVTAFDKLAVMEQVSDFYTKLIRRIAKENKNLTETTHTALLMADTEKNGNQQLHEELRSIKDSRAYKLAYKLQQSKNIMLRRR